MREIAFIYVRNIAFYIIFMNIILILTPNEKYKGYIKTMLAFVLIIIILKPINRLLEMRESINLDSLIEEYSIDIAKKEYREAEDKQRKLIKRQFEEDMLLEIKGLLKNEGEIEADKIKIEYIKDKNNENNIIGISKIDIYIKGGGDNMKIKNKISDFYKLNSENINIIKEETKDKEMVK